MSIPNSKFQINTEMHHAGGELTEGRKPPAKFSTPRTFYISSRWSINWVPVSGHD